MIEKHIVVKIFESGRRKMETSPPPRRGQVVVILIRVLQRGSLQLDAILIVRVSIFVVISSKLGDLDKLNT